MASVVLSYATNQWAARIDILGSTGTLLLDLQALSLTKYDRRSLGASSVASSLLRESVHLQKSILRNSTKYLFGQMETTHSVLLERFLSSIQNGTASPVTAEDGRAAVEVVSMMVSKLHEEYGKV